MLDYMALAAYIVALLVLAYAAWRLLKLLIIKFIQAVVRASRDA